MIKSKYIWCVFIMISYHVSATTTVNSTSGIATNDIQISAVNALPGYTWVPSELDLYYFGTGYEITNVGQAPQSNISIKTEIIVNGQVIDVINTATLSSTINSGDVLHLPLASHLATIEGTYSMRHIVELDGVIDENPADNTWLIEDVVEVLPGILARDNDSPQISVSIADGVGGYMGNMFWLFEPIRLSGVNFVYSNENCDTNPPFDCSLDGESIHVDVFSIDNQTGLPDVIVGSTEAHVVPDGISTFESAVVAFPTPLTLPPGKYVYAVTEPIRTVSTFDTVKLNLAASFTRFTLGTTWMNRTGDLSSPWINNEDLGFNVTYLIRPLFLEPDLIYIDGFE